MRGEYPLVFCGYLVPGLGSGFNMCLVPGRVQLQFHKVVGQPCIMMKMKEEIDKRETM